MNYTEKLEEIDENGEGLDGYEIAFVESNLGKKDYQLTPAQKGFIDRLMRKFQLEG